MKKHLHMIIPALIVLALVVGGCVIWLLLSKPEGPPGTTGGNAVTIYDAQGNVLLSTNTTYDIYESEQWAYLEIVLAEMTELIAEKEDCSLAQAREQLFTQAYQIRTSFDSTVFESLKALESGWGETCSTAGAVTDLNGNLLAVFCSDTEGRRANYALERRSPYSSFKALSVYTPAIEKKLINWSTMYQDSPYKQLEDETGELQGWPTNATNTYSLRAQPVYEALRQSLNTVAVKCLKDVGIPQSIEFLQTSFGIPLKEEAYVVAQFGEEEVVGNIALGYLETGITPVEMAGYYQIFSNGGTYTAPKTIISVSLEDGTNWYTRQADAKQVVSPVTADTMNKLLQGVVAPGGTGEAANVSTVEIAGKTGTGDDYADNWFVGVTPGYSLAVWHGKHTSNEAEEMFAAVVNALYSKLPSANRKFVTHKNLHQLAYCVKSGMAFSPNCATIDVGYFENQDALPVCDTCSKP